jgi:hypothetical protein
MSLEDLKCLLSRPKKYDDPLRMDIQVMAWEKNDQVVGLNQPLFLNWIPNGDTDITK